MLRVFEVSVSIRKGCGPEAVSKNITVAFDDLPEEINEQELKSMAIDEAEKTLYCSEDFPLYGKNWTIEGVYNS